MGRSMLWFIVGFLGLTTACLELEEEVKPEPPAQEEEVVKKETSEAKQYVIRQGQHSVASSWSIETVEKIKFKAKFDSTAIYQTVDSVNQADINKLYGLSDCSSHHHTNSARFGWRWYQNQLEIWAYSYVKGVRKWKFVDTVELGKFHEYEVEFAENEYLFKLNGKEVKIDRGCVGAAKGYKLYPYFGGDEVAPHNINIWIEEIKQ